MLPFGLGLEVSRGSSTFLNGVLGSGTATPSTDLESSLILTTESEAMAALAAWAHNLRNSKLHAFFGTRSKAASELSI